MTIEEYRKTQSIGKKKHRGKTFQIIWIVLCFSMIIFSLYTILNWHQDNSKIQQINQEIDKSIHIESKKKIGELVNPPDDKKSDYYYYANIPFYDVDFKDLLLKNADTIGFIQVPNTNIHYPIVQAADNSYYLKHDFHKEKNDAGWIFMDYRSDINQLGDNTVIYGHARFDESMFGSLKNTLTVSWQANRDNYVIFLSTPQENMLFQIFSIYTIANESYYITPNFPDDRKKKDWIDTMQKRNLSPIHTEVNVEDKILTLSTCQNVQDGRVVVHAKLIKRQKKKKDS